MLIIFSGLPGTGKTTIAKQLAKEIGAVYIRIDTVEQELKNLDSMKHGAAAYHVCYNIAKNNLEIGLTVVADSVNPINYTREKWRNTAKASGVKFIEIETICSDKKEHQKRVEERQIDIAGFVKPTWEEVLNREYEEFSGDLVVDTSKSGVGDSVKLIKQKIGKIKNEKNLFI